MNSVPYFSVKKVLRELDFKEAPNAPNDWIDFSHQEPYIRVLAPIKRVHVEYIYASTNTCPFDSKVPKGWERVHGCEVMTVVKSEEDLRRKMRELIEFLK